MNGTALIIQENFQEYYELAQDALSKKKWNGAVTLFYKALVELCDYALFQSLGKIGANHTERFELLQRHQPELYQIAHQLFQYYRDSYSKRISPTIAGVIKEHVDAAKKLVFSPPKM
ncbi:MAG: hypothetical protein AABX13_01935 [Nanoarchaeota archaeon]